MASIVLFTHTRWEEAPRIRHQVARLLRDFGHRVLFIERGDSAFNYRSSRPREVEANIWIARPVRAVHHQLRVASVLHHLDASIVAPVVRGIVDHWLNSAPDAIVNFAHDGWWLRQAFPSTRLVTIIHDDFEAQSRLPFHGHITWTLQRTCMSSDDVFAVSVPLQHRLQEWCSAKLLLPWAIDPYVSPDTDMASKDILLFWGTVDNALDLAMIHKISRQRPELRLLLVGPTQTAGARERIAASLAPLANAEIHPPAPLSALPIDRVLAAILPYRRTPAVNAVTLANKSMQLLARGLPLMISAMPNYLEQPFIVRMDSPDGISGAIQRIQAGFLPWQPMIKVFLDDHSPKSRLMALGFPNG
jgi:hypothetical protein